MTSSLVGSEMCIRDRLLSSARQPTCPWCRSRAAVPSVSFGMPPGPLASVSYTHLTLPTICSV
eukprot:6760006-Prorocentrum_lima.AAC.1